MVKKTRHILLVIEHHAFREALAVRFNQEEDLEVAWQAASATEARNVHLNGIDVAVVDPRLPDGGGLELIREVSVANPNASSLALSPELDAAMRQQALGAGATEALHASSSIEEVISAVRRSANAE